MPQAAEGDVVRVHYTGTLVEDGSVFDSSRERDPLEFTIGEGQLLPGFESAVDGLEPGQSTTVQIPAAEGYGEHHADRVVEVQRSELPDNLDPQVGQQYHVKGEGQQSLVVWVTALTETSVTLDGNHPLARKDLSFEIELVEIFCAGESR